MSNKNTALASEQETGEPSAGRTKGKVSPEANARVAERLPELVDSGWVRLNRAPVARLEFDDDGIKLNVRPPANVSDASAKLIFESSLGSTDPAFADGLIAQIVNGVSGWGKPDPKSFGFAMAVVQGIEPRDEIEGMLAAQMALVHIASMRFARNLTCAETLPQRDSCERTLNKLTRTFAAQVDALKRYRSTGEQKVTVQHVNVSEGGQAIVGNVTTGGGTEK